MKKTILLATALMWSCSKPEKNTMLTLTEIGLIKDGGSRQITFTNEAGELHSFYLQIEAFQPHIPHKDRKFIGFYSGSAQSVGELASHAQVQAVCGALQRWYTTHDTPKYRQLKSEWDLLARRLNEEIDAESEEHAQNTINRLKEIEGSDGWARNVIESKWIREAILALPSA